MKVLIDARMIGPQVHGIARYTADLVKGLNSKGPRITLLGSDREAILNHVPDECFNDLIVLKSKFASGFDAIELSRKVNFLDYDLVHFTSFSVPIRMPANSVVTIHDLIHLHDPGFLHWAFYNRVVKKALNQCAQVIAVSEWTKSEIHKYLDIPFKKIQVVRNGVQNFWFDDENEEGKTIPTEKPYFLCVSNLKKHKNVVGLIRACETLWAHGHDFLLYLVISENELPSSFKVSAETLKKIKLLSKVSDIDLKMYMKKAKAVVSPSLAEGFNYPVAEALAAGSHVVLSGGSSHDEFAATKLAIYRPADNVPALASTLLQVLKTDDKDEKTKHNVQTVQAMCDQTYAVYEKAIASAN